LTLGNEVNHMTIDIVGILAQALSVPRAWGAITFPTEIASSQCQFVRICH
jgi:hypothetical protein